MKHFIAFCRRNRLFAALLAAELAVVCALAAGLFGAPYKLALTPGDFTNTLPDIAAADDDGLKIWNQIGYHSDDPMTFSADNIALPSGAYEVTVRYFSCQTPDAPTFNMLNAAGSLTFASERSPAAVTFDALRLDHFRGFAAYYSVPARAKNARDGCWLPGPGLSLFSALQQALGDVPILAENLGFLDDTVRALLSDCGFPGMQVLQFDFDSRDCGGAVCKPNTVIYTGTHDNDTLLGWCTTAPRQDIRRTCAAYGVRYPNQLPRQMMLSALRSPANTCILTVQDLLGLGSSARINTPSTVGAHNWSWRMRPGALTPGVLAHLYTETCAADRAERSNICRI